MVAIVGAPVLAAVVSTVPLVDVPALVVRPVVASVAPGSAFGPQPRTRTQTRVEMPRAAVDDRARDTAWLRFMGDDLGSSGPKTPLQHVRVRRSTSAQVDATGNIRAATM
jgi:hypothetical protein